MYRYLGGGARWALSELDGQGDLPTDLFADIHVTTGGYLQKDVVRVPLVPESLVDSARRLWRLKTRATTDLTYEQKKYYDYTEKGSRCGGHGSVIECANIVLLPSANVMRMQTTVECPGVVRNSSDDTSEENLTMLESVYARVTNKLTDCQGFSDKQRIKYLAYDYSDYNDAWSRMFDARLASNVVVVLRGPSIQREVMTDGKGRFLFKEVPQGEYKLLADDRASAGQGRVARGSMRVQLSAEPSEESFLVIHDKPITIKGRISTADGQLIAGARITGSPARMREEPTEGDDSSLAYYKKRMHQHAVSSVSGPDGSYELVGITPQPVLNALRYLSRGIEGFRTNPKPEAAYSRFFIEVEVEADGYVQSAAMRPKVPLIVEDDVPICVRLAASMLPEAFRVRGRALRPEQIPLKPLPPIGTFPIPRSEGRTITGVDIVLSPINDGQKTETEAETEAEGEGESSAGVTGTEK
jgi:hypothetical protein